MANLKIVSVTKSFGDIEALKDLFVMFALSHKVLDILSKSYAPYYNKKRAVNAKTINDGNSAARLFPFSPIPLRFFCLTNQR